ncbi:hypothetical protein [Reyranella sp.]|uniref:hypothetical protein n=1 Tax=Reyranella sp. TaxID=1929291 RepID=UPI003BAAD386
MQFLQPILTFLHEWADAWVMLTAGGTIALAIVTFRVIRQGQRQREDTERQHRNRFKPVCLLAPCSGVDAWNRRGELLEVISPAAENPSCGTVAIRCVLRNVGVGPAVKLRLKFRFPDMNGWTSEPWELSPLGAGESWGSKTEPLLVPFPIHERFNQADFAMLAGKPWEIWLEYEDVFGRQFQSIHRKAPVDTDLSTATWTTAGGDQQPRASLRPVPWVTYTDGPLP